MKTTPASLILALGLLGLAGCTDASTAKRDDGRYVTLPGRISPAGAGETQVINPPGETGRRLAADKAVASTVVNEESPAQRKARESQEKFETDLAKLDSK